MADVEVFFHLTITRKYFQTDDSWVPPSELQQFHMPKKMMKLDRIWVSGSQDLRAAQDRGGGMTNVEHLGIKVST